MNNQSTKSVANQGRGLPPLIFGPNWGPKGRKKIFQDHPPLPLSRGQDDRTPSLSEGLDEYSNMINVREMFKSSLYVTKQKA